MAHQDSTKPPEQPVRPARWWQWLLIYPALAISLLTAAPQWIDKLQALANNVQNRSYVEAMEQHDLYEKNLSCTTLPFDWYSTPDDVDVDATLCDSGDLYVRAQTPDRKQFTYFVPLERVTGTTKSGGAAQTALILPERGLAKLAVSRVPATAAATNECQPPKPPPQQPGTATVVCTKFIDSRNVLRHVSTPDGCFDQVFDSYTGQMVRSTKVLCRTTC